MFGKKSPPSYILCTSPRSGSWMLCSILEQTGIAGHPTEYFGPTLLEEFLSNRGCLKLPSVEGFMDAVRANGSTINGVFGMKLLANQTEVFLRRAAEGKRRPGTSLRTALETEFPNLRYIWLRRNNTVAQAISYYRAMMTQNWKITGRETGLPRTKRPVLYDQFAIERCYEDILASDAYWEGFFQTHRLTPFVVTYEELLATRMPVIRRMFEYLGLPPNTRVPEPRTQKIANEESLAWEEEFRHRCGTAKDAGLANVPSWAPY